MPKITRALISLSDKTGIVEFARVLKDLKIEILSTGGTARLLRENGIPVVEVGDYTGQPEILDGRLKTLHPKIHGGILAIRSQARHIKEMEQSGIGPIDLVVVNLYPFEETIRKSNVSFEEAIENIDIGGPTMIRAAAKNWQDVSVVVDTGDYVCLAGELKKSGEISSNTNLRLAQKVFILTARYDGLIANYLTGGRDGVFPESFNYQGNKIQDLRYGENPHQKAAFYRDAGPVPSGTGWGGVAGARQLHGKELSFNNILDLDAAISLTGEFKKSACVIIKHTNPCGVAIGEISQRDIFISARECDPLSAFGGIIGFNRKVDSETAREIAKDFYECVIAPGFEPEAYAILAAKKNIRLMELPGTSGYPTGLEVTLDMKKVGGGLLIQDKDIQQDPILSSKVATKRPPSETEWAVLEFAWTVCKHVKSNAIVFAGKEGGIFVTRGMGCGQMSRVDATRIGISKSRVPLTGAAMASDAFFPFRDSVDEAAKAGVKSIIQPGGSLKDQESIDAANENGIAMVVTGIRHFRH